METRISGQRAEDISSLLGFKNVCCSNVVGFHGGIKILWNDRDTTLDILSVTDQAIHVFVQVCSSNPNSHWILSAIYASPVQQTNFNLWDDLANFATSHSLPWLLTVDFKDILSHNESLSSTLPSHKCIEAFNNLLNNCNLMDLGFSGPKFMWSNKRNNGLVMKRLDRALSNPQWKVLFEDAHVCHLPRTSSDHHPILLHTPPPPCTTLALSRFTLKPCGSTILFSILSSINPGQNTPKTSRQPWMTSLFVSIPRT